METITRLCRLTLTQINSVLDGPDNRRVQFPALALITLYRKLIEERSLLVVGVLRHAPIRRFGPRRTRYVPNLRQSIRSRPGLTYILRAHVGCRRWCDGVMGGESLRRNRFQRCIPIEQKRNQRQTYKCQKGESWHCLFVLPLSRGHK